MRLKSNSRKALEAIQPNVGKLKSVAPPAEQVFGYIVTTATGELQLACFAGITLAAPCFMGQIRWEPTGCKLSRRSNVSNWLMTDIVTLCRG